MRSSGGRVSHHARGRRLRALRVRHHDRRRRRKKEEGSRRRIALAASHSSLTGASFIIAHTRSSIHRRAHDLRDDVREVMRTAGGPADDALGIVSDDLHRHLTVPRSCEEAIFLPLDDALVPLLPPQVSDDLYHCDQCGGCRCAYMPVRRAAVAVDRYRIIVRCLTCTHRWEA